MSFKNPLREQPQEYLLSFLWLISLILGLITSLPQLHLQSQLLLPLYAITNNLPNLSPNKSLSKSLVWAFLHCSFLKHPHDWILPCVKQYVFTTVVLPQSQTQFHALLPPNVATLFTTSLPNLWLIKSSFLPKVPILSKFFPIYI